MCICFIGQLLWGPGATVGSNLIKGKKIVSVGKDTQGAGDIISGFETSHHLCHKLRTAFADLSYENLGQSREHRQALEAARDELAKCSDVTAQHLYCEIGKIGHILTLKRGKGDKYRRDPTKLYDYDPEHIESVVGDAGLLDEHEAEHNRCDS